jgi:hypothetical protein
MPSPDGYEVCRYVKTHEKLKHIPVMLLVGSFEPFDEAEARRVGADDILTKPFSSIRRLIERVGGLVSSPPAEKEEKVLAKEGPTAELPRTAEPAEEPRLSTEELEVTTADTMPLPENMLVDTLPRAEQSASAAAVTPSARLEALLSGTRSSQHQGTSEHEGRMEPGITETTSESPTESADVLLDLGDVEPAHAAADADDFVLDLEDAGDDVAAPAYAAQLYGTYQSTPMRAVVEPEVTQAQTPAYEPSYQPAVHSSFAETQDLTYGSDARNVTEIEPYESPSVPPELTPDPVPVFGETEFPVTDTPEPATTSHASTPISGSSLATFSADQLSPEMIDAIARRCVELMSDKVIREIAWDVVPDLAELLIKRQLEEKTN